MPDGVGRSYGLSGGSGGGAGSTNPLAKPTFNQVTQRQADNEADFMRRMDILGRNVPAIKADLTTMMELAGNSQLDDADMLEAAIGAIGVASLNQMVKDYEGMDPEEAMAKLNVMDPTVRDALTEAGMVISQDKQPGFWQMLKDGMTLPMPGINQVLDGIGVDHRVPTVGDAMGRALGVAAKVPGLNWGVRMGLKALAYPGEEVNRLTRANEIMASGQRLIEQTGMSEAELEARGITMPGRAAQSDTFGIAGGGSLSHLIGGGFGQLLEFRNPARAARDLVSYAQTWWEIGHQGDDDLLPEIQWDVYSDLEEAYRGEGSDLLRYAKALARNTPIDEIVAAEGITGEAGLALQDRISGLMATPDFRSAVQRLTTAQMSPGRTVVRAIARDQTIDTTKGWAKYVSGGTDAFWVLATDPLNLVASVHKASKIAKAGIPSKAASQGAVFFNRAQGSAHLVRLIRDNVDGVHDEMIDALRKKLTEAGIARPERVGQEFNAVAEDIARNFQIEQAGGIADWHGFGKRYPRLQSSIADMQIYHRNLITLGEDAGKAKALAGLADPDNVFEFYKHAAGHRNFLHTLDSTMAVGEKNATELFGHNPRAMFIPRQTNAQRRLAATREALGGWRDWDGKGWGAKLIDDAGRDITQAPTSVQAYLDEVARETMAKQGLEPKAGFFDNHLRWVPEASRPIRERVNTLYRTLTSPVPRARYLNLATAGTDYAGELIRNPYAYREFGAFNEMVGLLTGDPDSLIKARYNLFVSGNIADRHVLVNEVIQRVYQMTGELDTAEGREFFERFIAHRNQFYGIGQDATRTWGETADLIRQAVHEGQLSNQMAIPDFRQVLIGTRKANTMRHVAGGVRSSHVEALSTRYWKQGQLLKLSYPLRATADETLQYMFRVGSMRWIRSGILEDWAGLYDETGKELVAPKGFIRPLQNFSRGLATMFNVTQDTLVERARTVAAANDRDFIEAVRLGDKAREAELLGKYMDEARGTLKPLPRSVAWLDEHAHRAALFSSTMFHDHISRGFKPRQKFAQTILERYPDFERRIEAARLALSDPRYEQAQAAAIHANLADVRPSKPETRYVGFYDKDVNTASGYRYVQLKGDNRNWVKFGHNDPSGFYSHYDSNLRNLHQDSPSARAAMEEHLHFVDQSTADELSRLSAYVGGDGPLGTLANARQALEDDLATFEGRFGMLEWAAAKVNAGEVEQGWDLAQLLKDNGMRGVPNEVEISEETLAILRSLDDLNPSARFLLTDQTLNTSKITTDRSLIETRAAKAAENALFRLNNQSNLRKMVRVNTVGGRSVVTGVPDGHVPIYMPMVDRRQVMGLVEILQEPDKAEQLAERLAVHLRRNNLMRHFDEIWKPLSPSEDGWELATVLAGWKADIAENGKSYLPGLFTGSTNPAIAESIRDALADVLPEGMLRPTIGKFHHPQELIDKAGVKRVNDALLQVAPYRALKLEPMDPENYRVLTGVKTDNGTLWLDQAELDDFTTGEAFLRTKPVAYGSINDLTRFETGNQRIKANTKALNADWADGAKFLRGEGGDIVSSRKIWGWDDDDLERAQWLGQALEERGLEYIEGLDLEDLVHRAKNPQFYPGPIPFKEVMEDDFPDELLGNSLWDEFQDLVSRAGRTEEEIEIRVFSQTTADASKITKAALDEMGIDVDELVSKLSEKKYRKLLIEREKAAAALRPPGVRPDRSPSPEAVTREIDALSHAFRELGLEEYYDPRGVPFLTKKLEDHYEVVGQIVDSGLSEVAGVRATAQGIAEQVREVTYGQKSGRVMHEIIGPLRRGEYRTEMLWDDVDLNELPQFSYGPAPLLAEETRWDKVNDRFHKGIADPIINGIGRSPMFLDYFQDGLDQMQPVFDNLRATPAQRQAVEDALEPYLLMASDLDDYNKYVVNRMLDNVDFGDPEDDIALYLRELLFGDADGEKLGELLWKSQGFFDESLPAPYLSERAAEALRKWHLSEARAYKMWTERAYTRATELIAPYIDDFRIRSMFQEYIGPVVMPYWYAEEQFLRRFARGIIENPMMLRRMQLTMQGLTNVGVMDEDRYGNKIFVIPLSGALSQVVADAASLVFGSDALQAWGGKPWQMRAEYVLPGWNLTQSRLGMGPVIGVTAEWTQRRFPELQPANWSKSDYTQYMVPGPFRGFYKAFIEDPDPTQANSLTIATMGMLEASGHGLPQDASAVDREKYYEDVRNTTRVLGAMRYITGMLTFTGAQPIDVAATFQAEYLKYLELGMSPEDAMTAFLQEHDRNPDDGQLDTAALVYTVFRTENTTGTNLPATESSWQWMRENGDFVQNNPELAAWFIPDTDEPFDVRAYNEQLALEMRVARTPEEIWKAMHIKQSAEEYYTERDNYEAARQNALDRGRKQEAAEHDDRWRLWSQAYRSQHPVFAESFSPEAGKRRESVLEQMRWATDPAYSSVGGQMAEELRGLVTRYHQFNDQYRSYRNQSSKVARKIKKELLEEFMSDAWLYIQEHPQSRSFYYSVIRPELPSTADAVEVALQGSNA